MRYGQTNAGPAWRGIERVNLRERTVNRVQTAGMIIQLKSTLRTFGVLIAMAGIVLTVAPRQAWAQNAAQQATLARVGRSAANPNSVGALTGGAEATTVPLSKPGGLAFDAAGNLYFADTDDNVICEVNLAGVLTIVAGSGEQGFDGDNGAATSASLDSPVGVAVDSASNLYIADTHNNRIREVTGGVITTIAGTGVAGFSGDGGAATSAALDLPTAVAVDSKGNIYIADTNNHRVREISGTNISTIAGDGEQTYSGDNGPATAAGLDSPRGVAVDAAFNVYIGDTHNQLVRMVTFSTGIISTLAGTGVKGFTADGPATSAALAGPRGVAVDASGNVYFADSDNDRIRTVTGGNVNTIAGNGSEGFSGDTGLAVNASVDTPRAVAVIGNSVAFADSENNRIRAVNNGAIQTIAGVAPPGTESIALGGAMTAMYGTGSITASFSNGSLTATGSVTFYDGEGSSPSVIGTASLAANSASISTSQLSAGTHYIVASYGGDTNNAAVTSGVYVFVVTPAPLTAVANAVNLLYGQAIPALTGTLSGVLAQDSGKVTAAFSTLATITSAPGTYPIDIALTGSAAADYTLSLGAGSGAVAIAQAPTITTLTGSTAKPVAGAAFTLTAKVASTTSGTPTGTVSFFNGASMLSSTPTALSGGVATLTLSTLPVGALNIVAVYGGDTNFIASNSSTLGGTVISPDFTVAPSPAAQTLLPSASANYTITLTPTNPTFIYPVSLSASGLPAGVTATFAPASIPAGAAASTSTMTLSASNLAYQRNKTPSLGGMATRAALALLLLPMAFGRRARRAAARLSRAGRMLIALLALVALGAMSGCGGGGFFSHATQTYTVTVTAVSGPNTHTTDVTLTVQ
ncbi:Ig-like domain repeat protein [Acidicapsa acidisoli]|uniref:Ig-like domain repeat protein n=1 Tax=Acidicapsa acidisoli TaxID=1615681 RepID=UPI0021DFFFE7|nr:Ig-like domain repeat protein [Acidicapsa acidisoli]